MTKQQEILAQVPEADRDAVASLSYYFGNTRPGQRPSDSARQAVAEYNNGRLEHWEDIRAAERAHIHRTECQFPSCGRCAEIEANQKEQRP